MRMLRESLERHEGRRTHLYRCTGGKLTIGIGHNIEDNGLPHEVIDLLFLCDVDSATAEAITWLGLPGAWERIKPERQAVIIELLFNMGLTRMRTFKKFRAAILVENWPWAAAEMLDSKWAREDVSKARSGKLSEQVRTGIYRRQV